MGSDVGWDTEVELKLMTLPGELVGVVTVEGVVIVAIETDGSIDAVVEQLLEYQMASSENPCKRIVLFDQFSFPVN
jgi:hypothetical protein